MHQFAPLLFLPVILAALVYPVRRAAAIGTAGVLVSVVLGLAAGVSAGEIAVRACCLAIAAALCVWKAHENRSRHAALALVSRADPLTGCLNRRGFEERVEAELSAASRNDRTAVLILLDLDDFKQVNDSRGHAAGDELLRWTVERAGKVLRPMDSLGRLGGDEFAIVVPEASPAEGREVASRLRDALAERVSVSTGLASFPNDGSDRESLYRRADNDLYAAKHRRGAALDESASTVAQFASAIGRRLGWSGSELSLLRMAAMLHDVGKVSVPAQILEKTGPLTVAEYELIKTHSVAGAEIVEQVDGLYPIAGWIRHSHEHFDGSGYPGGLVAEQIPVASRILLVAEAYDAMMSDRPYGAALTADVALDELRRNAGAQFDPDCVTALEQHLAADDELVAA
jgi:diguanylate cyclase (GGDEF)-like protein